MSEDRETLYALGQQYFSGDGRPKDLEAALDCFQRSADLGYAPAQFEVGLAYDPTGRAQTYGIAGDRDISFEWFLKAAEQGDRKAMSLVAMGYLMGLGGKFRDQGNAAKWYAKLVPLGDTYAMIQLGLIEIERKQIERGRELLGAAAELGDPYALALYRNYVEEGLFPALDPNKELALLESAAKQGDNFAMLALGLKYEKGEGVPADLAKAYALLSWVSVYEQAKGRPGEATEGVERLKDKLSPDELKTADDLIHVMPEKLSLD
ncbi:MAG TPA: tetratricopeptide repeat protein [Gemmatimonadaceae bacterium]